MVSSHHHVLCMCVSVHMYMYKIPHWIWLGVSFLLLSSFMPLFSVCPLISPSSSHVLSTSSLFYCALYFPSSSVTLTLSVHSFTPPPELPFFSLSLILYFLHLCSLRGLISIPVTANSWSVSSTPLDSTFILFFLIPPSVFISFCRKAVNQCLLHSYSGVVNLWIACDEKENRWHKICSMLPLNSLTQCSIDLSLLTARIKEMNRIKREQIT